MVVTEIQTTSAWYKRLLEKLKELIAKRERVDLEIKLEMGKAILAEKPNIKEPMTKFLEMLAKDLQVSVRELWYCVGFAEKYPTIDRLKEDYANAKGVSNDTVSLENLPAWRDIRNTVLQTGLKRYLEETKSREALEPSERKLCDLEQFLMDLYRAVYQKKDPMLNCNECEIREKCATVKAKLLLFGEQYFSD